MKLKDCYVVKASFKELPDKIVDSFCIVAADRSGKNSKIKCFEGSNGLLYAIDCIASALGVTKSAIFSRDRDYGCDSKCFLSKKIAYKDRAYKKGAAKRAKTIEKQKTSSLEQLSNKPRSYKLKDIK